MAAWCRAWRRLPCSSETHGSFCLRRRSAWLRTSQHCYLECRNQANQPGLFSHAGNAYHPWRQRFVTPIHESTRGKGYTYGAYSSLDARRTAGTFRASAEVRTPVTGDSLKEFFHELSRIRSEPASEKEIADAKSYLTGVFPIRLETQEGLIDQLVQIKMFGLADDYLELYRNRIQEVTIPEVQEVAKKYVKPDEAAIVIVGDAAQLVDQMKPYVDEIEFYSTAGKKKDRPAAAAHTPEQAAALAGNWSLKIDTPLGQAIPATLILANTAKGISGKVESEMGNGELLAFAFDGESFSGTISFDISGHAIEAQIEVKLPISRWKVVSVYKTRPACLSRAARVPSQRPKRPGIVRCRANTGGTE